MNMEKEVYILLVKGSDGQFCFSDAFSSFEAAEEALNGYNEAQIMLESASVSDNYIDEHKFDRPFVPGFVINDADILKHTTLTIVNNGSETIKTDRYIIKLAKND